MPKPSQRLILFSLLPLPAALMVGAAEVMLLLCLGLYLLLALAATIDILLSHHRLELGFSTCRQIRQSKGQRGNFDMLLTFKGEDAVPPWIRIGLPLPRPLECENAEQKVALLQSHRNYHLSWDFLSPERGLYHIEKMYWQVPSRLGLWLLQGSTHVDLPIHIYPDLRPDMKTLANLFMNRGTTGMKRQRVTGHGRDYDSIREYMPGDSILDIHWKASAKRNQLMAKTYQIERTQEIYVIIDHSRLSARKISTITDDNEENVLERFIATANVLGLAAIREGDLFGIATFSRTTTNFIRASTGPAHLKSIQNSLFNLKAESVFPDFDELFHFIRMNLRRRSLIILLTDISDPAVFESLSQRVQLINQKHILLVNMILMQGVQPIFNRSKEDTPHDLYEHLAGHLIWKDLQNYKKLLMQKRTSLHLLSSEHIALDIVNQYLTIKQRQLL